MTHYSFRNNKTGKHLGVWEGDDVVQAMESYTDAVGIRMGDGITFSERLQIEPLPDGMPPGIPGMMHLLSQCGGRGVALVAIDEPYIIERRRNIDVLWKQVNGFGWRWWYRLGGEPEEIQTLDTVTEIVDLIETGSI